MEPGEWLVGSMLSRIGLKTMNEAVIGLNSNKLTTIAGTIPEAGRFRIGAI